MSDAEEIQITFDPSNPWDMPDELFNKLVGDEVIPSPFSNRIIWNEVCRKLADPEYRSRSKLIDKAVRRLAHPGGQSEKATRALVAKVIKHIMCIAKGEEPDAAKVSDNGELFDDLYYHGRCDSNTDYLINALLITPRLEVDI